MILTLLREHFWHERYEWREEDGQGVSFLSDITQRAPPVIQKEDHGHHAEAKKQIISNFDDHVEAPIRLWPSKGLKQNLLIHLCFKPTTRSKTRWTEMS
jgi:hypothetical protein